MSLQSEFSSDKIKLLAVRNTLVTNHSSQFTTEGCCYHLCLHMPAPVLHVLKCFSQSKQDTGMFEPSQINFM